MRLRSFKLNKFFASIVTTNVPGVSILSYVNLKSYKWDCRSLGTVWYFYTILIKKNSKHRIQKNLPTFACHTIWSLNSNIYIPWTRRIQKGLNGQRTEMLTTDIRIEFGHLQEKAYTPLRKPVLVSQQWNLTIAHPLPVVHLHCKEKILKLMGLISANSQNWENKNKKNLYDIRKLISIVSDKTKRTCFTSIPDSQNSNLLPQDLQ